MMKANKSKLLLLTASSILSLSSCNFNSATSSNLTSEEESSSSEENPNVTYKEISKEEYRNKTLAGLLGQFAGFLSGYEFAVKVGLPESWFDFINGPYAGNYEHFTPGDAYRYDRLRVNPETGRNEVFSDDDYHIDIFNQTIIDELGTSSYAIKETWKKYGVSDWGGGGDAMRLINQKDMLSPFSGKIEAGNRYGWCTESYIEVETLGMNAPGMPSLALSLTDTFSSNVGYFDSVIWGKFYATMYSLAYFEDDINVVMEKASATLPKNSHPRQFYDLAFSEYKANPNDYAKAAENIADARIPLYRIDNIQTDPNVNGSFAILSWLYGKNDYMDTCKYSSIMGYDGDCTGAICTGVMGILKGFKKENEEYEKLNSMIYYDGEGVYFNDDGSYYEGDIYQARIVGENYPKRQKIDDIVSLYTKNFEKLLLENGGEVKEESYLIPTTSVPVDTSLLFDNYDAEKRSNDGFETSGANLEVFTEGENASSHSGYAGFRLTNSSEGKVYHAFKALKVGETYRLSTYVKGLSGNAEMSLFALDENNDIQEITFQTNDLINKTFVFKATSQKMQVGIKFNSSSNKGDSISFDDFMVEKISRTTYSEITTDLKLSNGSFVKTVKRPSSIELGKEVNLLVKYRNYGSSSCIKIVRNGKTFGGVIASKTSLNSTSGFSYLEIPYIFEKDTDTVKIEFDGKMYFSDFGVISKSNYMFR